MNGEIAFDICVLDRSAEEQYVWADNELFMTMRPPVYNPKKLISMCVWQDSKRIDISMTQEEFITMARALNNEKNKLLKWRRQYDADKKQKLDNQEPPVQQVIEGDGKRG